jgi:molecular chaperone HscC
MLFSPIIERNTPIPASRESSYHTVKDQQTEVQFNIFQGESRRTLDNVELGELCVKVPPAAAGEEQIDVRFTYDISGLLEVQATVVSTGEHGVMILQREESLLDDKGIATRLAELAQLKQHPRENAPNIAAIARAERLYQEYLGDTREFIGNQLKQFEQALSTQDPQVIGRALETLTQVLSEVEGR